MPLQGRTWESNVSLRSAGVPVTGIVPASITSIKFRKTGDTSFQTKIPSVSNWREIGSGLYVLTWSETDMSGIGSFWFSVAGATFDAYIETMEVIPNPLSNTISPPLCTITGNIMDLGGEPDQSQQLRFRIAKYPAALYSAMLSGTPKTTVPDANGSFSVSLVRGAIVIVEIDNAGLKVQFTVPNQETATLLSLIPTINNAP